MNEPRPVRGLRPRLLEAWAWLTPCTALAVTALFVGVLGWPPAHQAGVALASFALIGSVLAFPLALLLVLAVRADARIRRASLALGAALALAVAAGTSALHGPTQPRPEGLETARAVVSRPGLGGAAVFEDPSLGVFGDLRVLDGADGDALLLVGSMGAAFLDAALRPLRVVHFEQPIHRPRAVPLGGGGFAFLGRGSWCCRVQLLDASGAELWSYGDEVGVDDAAAGDLDGDGALDVVVGFNGGGGVHLLDAAGRLRWREPDGNVWRVALLDLDGDARPEIVHSNAAGQMVVREPDGRVRDSGKPPAYFSDFSTLERPGAPPALVHAEDDAIWILSPEAVEERLPAPLAGSLGDAFATWVRLVPGEAPLLAVAVDFRKWDRSVLYLYDSTRHLVHQEVLAGRTLALAAQPRTDLPGSDDLLLVRPTSLERWRVVRPSGAEPTVLEADRRP